MKILVKKIDKELSLPKVMKVGEWVDLRASTTGSLLPPFANTLHGHKGVRDVVFNNHLIPLGIAMKIPEGYEAIIAPRSSSFRNFGFIQSNSIGIVDSSYCGDTDEWMLPIIPLKEGYISRGDRVCQFRIQLSQKATVWQKIKWLFSNKIELIEVESLNTEARGGFGSTGKV